MHKYLFNVVLLVLSLSIQKVHPMMKLGSEQIYNTVKLFSPFISRNRFTTEQQPHTPPPQEKQPKKTVRILSIDGGGIRGIIPLTILKEIEEQTGKRICHLFDVISGTSTGGIIALALNVPEEDDKMEPLYTAEDVLNMYLNDGNKMFAKSRWRKIIWNKIYSAFTSKYDSEKSGEFLQEKFQKILLSESITTTIVPAYNTQRSDIHLFDSYESLKKPKEDYYMKDVALATSAAPTFFKPHRVWPVDKEEEFQKEYVYRNKKTSDIPNIYLDGGISLNNPTLKAYVSARKRFPEANDFFIVSLGTGTSDDKGSWISKILPEKLPEKCREWLLEEWSGYPAWGLKIANLITEAPSKSHAKVLEDLLELDDNLISPEHKRFQPTIQQDLRRIDNIASENVGTLQIITEAYLNSTQNDVAEKFKKTIQKLKELSEERERSGKSATLRPGIDLCNKNNMLRKHELTVRQQEEMNKKEERLNKKEKHLNEKEDHLNEKEDLKKENDDLKDDSKDLNSKLASSEKKIVKWKWIFYTTAVFSIISLFFFADIDVRRYSPHIRISLF